MCAHTYICTDMTPELEPSCMGIRERGDSQGEDFNCVAEDGMRHDRRLINKEKE